MFYHDIHTTRWSLKMISENFQDWLYQSCIERDKEKRDKEKKENDKNRTK